MSEMVVERTIPIKVVVTVSEIQDFMRGCGAPLDLCILCYEAFNMLSVEKIEEVETTLNIIPGTGNPHANEFLRELKVLKERLREV
jgi:hypothetical protein